MSEELGRPLISFYNRYSTAEFADQVRPFLAPNTGCLDCNRYEVNAARLISVFIMFIMIIFNRINIEIINKVVFTFYRLTSSHCRINDGVVRNLFELFLLNSLVANVPIWDHV